jgi:hypothetical protein
MAGFLEGYVVIAEGHGQKLTRTNEGGTVLVRGMGSATLFRTRRSAEKAVEAAIAWSTGTNMADVAVKPAAVRIVRVLSGES